MEIENQEVDTSQESNEPQYTEMEHRALEMGWRPKDDFDGTDDDFVDAKEFVARKPLYDKIGQQSKQIKNVTAAVEALKEHYGKVQETEYKRALAALKDTRKQALVEGDADKFQQADDQIKDVEGQVAELKAETSRPAVQEEAAVHPEFANWMNKNPWYGSIKYMKEYADDVGARLANTMSPAEVLKEVEKQVRKEFPQKFVNSNKQDAPEVGRSSGAGRSRGNDMELNEQETRIMNTLVRSGAITKEKYLADLKLVKGIK